MSKKKIRHSTASYVHEDGSHKCDLVELAKAYVIVGNIPERIGWTKAQEIALLSEAFLILYERCESDKKRGGKG